MNEEPDYDEIEPGIRMTVRKLREWGFATTDSGDGKHPQCYDFDFPHVFMDSTRENVIAHADLLLRKLRACGIDGDEVTVQADYHANDQKAVIMLFGVDDEKWRWEDFPRRNCKHCGVKCDGPSDDVCGSRADYGVCVR